MSAEFKVIKIDPEGSGADYQNHLGLVVTNAKRCCKNCAVIFGTIGDNHDFGPFIPGELEPINEEAKLIQSEIDKEEFIRKFSIRIPRKIVYSERYLSEKEKIIKNL